jgi:class 3 adenylate cyclase/tetratricopeptide (TPR) repeat protein
MQCPKCHFDNPEQMQFCGKCGARLENICPQCKSSNPSEFNFCGKCGHALREPEEAPAMDYSEPQTYTPKHLADKILTTRSSIEGERKLVTVLFADVANFTSISEKLDPEEIHSIMDGCFRILMDEIHRFDGTINQFTGDGVMALFGAPLAHEDHGQRACHAALSIQNAMENYGSQLKEEFTISFKMRIGLNSGPVVVGSIGDDLRMDYTAVGDTTNLASRMESMAEPGRVILSRNTYRLVRDYFEFINLGNIDVKGKTEHQEIFELLGTGDVDTRIAASVAKGLTQFVGRKNAIRSLVNAYNKARTGSGQVVGVVGDAGVGKSRLLLEFRNQLSRDEFTYFEGQCLPFGGTMAYLPVLDILRSYFNIKEGDLESLIKKNVETRILKLNDKLHRVLAPFYDLLSLDVEDSAYEELEPRQKREMIFEAIRDLLVYESQKNPVIIVVEDLHWIDRTSEEFLDYLIGGLTGARILLLFLYRPEYTHPWGSKSYYNRIGLEQLTPKSSAELMRSILQVGEAVPELEALILDRAAGNPLFMEEITHTLVENRSIRCIDGRCLLIKDVAEIQVPDTIEGIIAARMDRLEDPIKRTLQVASVIGRDFPYRILETITEMKQGLKSYLLNLQDLEFIYEKSLFPELEYVFKHALTREVAYNSLLQQRRKEIHEKIGRALEAHYPERLEEFYEMLAYHYYEGQDWTKALNYLAMAGDKAAAAYANREALDYYARALEVCHKLGASALKKSTDVARKRGLVNQTIGEFRNAIDDFNRMLAAARSLEDRHLEGMALAYRGWVETEGHLGTAEDTLKASLAIADEGFEDVRLFADVTLGSLFLIFNRHSEAVPLLREAEKLAPEVEDPFIQGWWSMTWSLWSNWKGRFGEALKIQTRLRDAIRRGGVPFLMNAWVEALCRGGKGEYEPALALLEEVLSAAKRMEEFFYLARGQNTLGWIYGELQDHRQAMTWNMQGIETAQEANFFIPECESNARLNLGDNFLALGQFDEAEEQFQKVEQVIRNPRPQDHYMLWRYSQHFFHSYGELWLARGNLDKTIAYTDECLALAQQSNSQKNIVKGRRLRTQVFLSQCKLDDALQELSIALDVARRIGNPPQLWKTYAVLGDLRQAQGQKDEAYRAYGDALSIIEKMATSLQKQSRRDTFISSHPVQEIRQKAQKDDGNK